MELAQYIKSISTAATTILEGMAVTFSHLFREPITIQYPDKTDRPVTEMLPPRYRGFLEVQMDICTGCKRCERACPIECIAIDLVKDPATKKQAMSRFDIDMGKCMYLSEVPVGEYGPHAREARERGMRDNIAQLEELRAIWRQTVGSKKKSAGGGKKKQGKVQIDAGKAEKIKSNVVVTPKGDVNKFALLLETLTAQTDCGACGYPTCLEYTTAMAGGADMDPSKCEPGGAECRRRAEARPWWQRGGLAGLGLHDHGDPKRDGAKFSVLCAHCGCTRRVGTPRRICFA